MKGLPSDLSILRKLKKVAAVSQEKIQERLRSGDFPAASKFTGQPLQQGISDSHSLLKFSDCRAMEEENSPFDGEVQRAQRDFN